MSSSAARYLPGILRKQAPVSLAERVCVPTDETLLSTISAGDKQALSTLFRRYARLVRAIGYKILRDEAEADDLLQDVFIFILNKSRVFDCSKNSARSWIVQVTYHRAIDRRRYLESRRFYDSVNLDDVIKDLPNPAGCKCRIQDQLGYNTLPKLFENLSENQRETLSLFFFEGYTLDEIASKLGQSRGNIKNHYFRGLDKLRKQVLEIIPRRHSGV